jgi:hypothetical protein
MAAKQILTHEQKWNARFEELKTYFEENGHSDIPVHHKVNKPLGTWAYAQRKIAFKEYLTSEQWGKDEKDSGISLCSSTSDHRKKMIQDRINKLCSLNFKFVQTTIQGGKKTDERWNARFEELKAYNQKHGNSDVPVRCHENPKLGWWVNNQKKFYKKVLISGSKETPLCPLTHERIKKLQTVGFKFTF